ncbi:flagellar export chaperone FliS [Fibrobacterota bacterium]
MHASGYQSYKTANISTADRGKLIVMVYDHCIKWCKVARDNMKVGDIENTTKAVFKIQEGITELTCSLDMDNGGEIANNLFNLYNFYNRHLSAAIRENKEKPIQEVEEMLSDLRSAWLEAVEIVRKEDRSKLKENYGNQIKMVG